MRSNISDGFWLEKYSGRGKKSYGRLGVGEKLKVLGGKIGVTALHAVHQGQSTRARDRAKKHSCKVLLN